MEPPAANGKCCPSSTLLLLSLALLLVQLPSMGSCHKEMKSIYDVGQRLLPVRLGRPAFGPESLAFDHRGDGPYTGVSNGRVLRWRGGSHRGWTEFAHNYKHETVAECAAKKRLVLPESVCGRPLGLQFHRASGDLYYADAYLGLMRVGRRGGKAEVVAAEAGGAPLNFVNGVDVDQETGHVYFTASSATSQRRMARTKQTPRKSTGPQGVPRHQLAPRYEIGESSGSSSSDPQAEIARLRSELQRAEHDRVNEVYQIRQLRRRLKHTQNQKNHTRAQLQEANERIEELEGYVAELEEYADDADDECQRLNNLLDPDYQRMVAGDDLGYVMGPDEEPDMMEEEDPEEEEPVEEDIIDEDEMNAANDTEEDPEEEEDPEMIVDEEEEEEEEEEVIPVEDDEEEE